MPNDDTEILHPKKQIKIGDTLVEVRELAWPDAMKFCQGLAENMASIYKEDGSLNVSLESLGEIVAKTTELSTFLIEKSTGRNAADFSMSQGLDVLDVALELNLSEEIVPKGKKIATRFKDFADAGSLRGTKVASPKPTSSSSNTATPAPN